MFSKTKKYFDSKIGIVSNPVLWNSTIIFTLSGLLCLLLILIDSRQVTGINTWIKPSKFAFSIASYTIIIAYIFPKLDIAKKTMSRLAWVSAIFLGFEYFLITMQAARGVRSHFNQETVFDGVVYGLMGITIIIAIIPAFFTTYYAFKKSKIKNKLYSLAVQYGLITFIIGSAYGGKVSSGSGHSIGAEDGVPGLPYLNWSTQFGDLRVFHFLAIHGIHVYLLAAWLLSKYQLQNSPKILKIFMSLYFLLSVGILILNELGMSTLGFLNS